MQYIINRRSRINKAGLGHASAKMMKKSISARNRMDKRIEEKEGLMVNIEDVPSLTMNYCPNYHQVLLGTEKLGLSIQDEELFTDLNLVVRNHGVVSLEGKNGTGKSTLLKLLLGKARETKYQGKYSLASGLPISYLPQNFTIYNGSLKDFAQEQAIII